MSILPSIADVSTLTRLEWRGHWLTPSEYAAVANRSPRTIYHWCQRGIFDDFHIPFFRDKRGRWWIKHIP